MDVDFLRYKFEDGYDGVITKSKFKIGLRHVQIIYMFMVSLVMGAMRGSTGVAMLAISETEDGSYVEAHHWDRRIQGIIMSSFLLGYALTLLPAEKYLTQVGEKFVLTSVLLINGSLSAAMPTVVNKGGWIATANAQFVLGMTQACVTPINQKLITNWLPPFERLTYNRLVQGGLLLGIIISLPISGILSTSRLGWELIFYSQAMMTFSMAAIWGLLTASTPGQHKAVGESESDFIAEAIRCYFKKKLKKPYRRIISTPQFWALAGVHATTNAVFIFFLVDMPAYLRMFNISLTDATFQVPLPFVSMWLVYMLTSPSFDWIYRSAIVDHFVDVKHFRKIVNGMGLIGTVTGLIFISYTPVWNHSVVILMAVLGCVAVQFSGFLETHRDMTQNFAGTLFVMTSIVASIFGALIPLVTGIIIGDDMTDKNRWNVMFYTLSCLCVVSSIFYTIFGSSDQQLWDNLPTRKFGYINDTNLELEEHGYTRTKHTDKEIDTMI